MRDKVMAFIKEHKLWLVFFAAAMIKQLLVIGVPICAVAGTPCDDELMRDWAFSIAGFDWLGDFNAYTFMKEPGFAVFLAICFKLHLPYIFAVSLGYSIACMIFGSALKNIFSSNKYVLCIYLVLLFHPISFCSTVLQKVYRNGLGVVLTLCIFGGLLHMYFSICKERIRLPLFWAAFTGLSLGCLWVTKSDTVWLLPFTGTICLVMLGQLLVKHRHLKSLPRYLCLVLPFLGIFLCSSGVKFLNIQRYGISSLEYYGAAMDQFTHIKSGQEGGKILLTRKQLKELYKISPTLAGVEEDLEREMDAHSTYDTNPEDGEVETGWLGWALVRGFHDAGIYEDSEKADAFFKNVYEELEAAFADGKLERTEIGTAQKYYIDTPAHRRELAGRTLEAIDYMVSCRKTSARLFYVKSNETEGSIRQFEQITRNKNVYHSCRHDYFMKGWLVFPEYDGKKLNVYLEDEEGVRYQKVEWDQSVDVYNYLKCKDFDVESARNCRFHIDWDIREKDTSFYLGVYAEGQPADGRQVEEKVDRLKIKETGFESEGGTKFLASLDAYFCRQDEEEVAVVSKAAVKRLNCIRSLYRTYGRDLFQLGILTYIIFTVVFIRGLRKREFDYVNPWLITTGLGLSVLVLAAGIAYVDLTQCPAIKTLYLSSGYPILMGAELISLCKCAELAMDLLQRRKEQMQYRIKKRIIGQS